MCTSLRSLHTKRVPGIACSNCIVRHCSSYHRLDSLESYLDMATGYVQHEKRETIGDDKKAHGMIFPPASMALSKPKLQINTKPPGPILRLPLELLLDITSYLSVEALISFTFAHFEFAWRCGLAPSLSRQQLSELLKRVRCPRLLCLIPFPAELMLPTIRLLRPTDRIAFVLANYSHLAAQGIAPRLTDETIRSLRASCWDRGLPECKASQ